MTAKTYGPVDDPEDPYALLRQVLGEGFHAALRKAIPDSRYGAAIEAAIDHMPDEEWDLVLRHVVSEFARLPNTLPEPQLADDIREGLEAAAAGDVVSADVVREDLELRATRTDGEFSRAITQMTWHVVPDDLVGGWAFATADLPASQLPSAGGGRLLGDVLTEELARYITRLHNRELKILRARRAQGE
jgi:hypothetical protein